MFNKTYIIYPGQFPKQLPNYIHYRGNPFSIKLIAKNDDDTPFDLSSFDSFGMQFRGRPKDIDEVADFDGQHFILSQTDEAIVYDANQGNPSGTTLDHLHIYETTGDPLRVSNRYLFTDVRTDDIGLKSIYLCYFNVMLIPNITKTAEEIAEEIIEEEEEEETTLASVELVQSESLHAGSSNQTPTIIDTEDYVFISVTKETI